MSGLAAREPRLQSKKCLFQSTVELWGPQDSPTRTRTGKQQHTGRISHNSIWAVSCLVCDVMDQSPEANMQSQANLRPRGPFLSLLTGAS